MSTPRSNPRTRSTGGRALMLLGVLLALLSGVLVIFIVSQATATVGQTMQVVVAKQDIPANTILTTGATDPTQHFLNIQDAFGAKAYPASLVPPNAYIYTTLDDLQVHVNNEVAVTDIPAGDVLRNADPRLQLLGSSALGSMTSIAPNEIQSGDVLFAFNFSNPGGSVRSFVVAGDHIDILATECNLPPPVNSTGGTSGAANSGCATQTTLQNVYVYATFTNSVVVVLTYQHALDLKYLVETGKIDLAIRNPKDSGPNAANDATTAVTPQYISSQFNF